MADGSVAPPRPAPAAALGSNGARPPAEAWLPLLQRLAYGQEWDGPQSREFAAFRDWTNRFRLAPANERQAMTEEGVELARGRRSAMKQLIERDPARALAWTVPIAVREILPAAVLAELEVRVSGRGDYAVNRSTPAPDGPQVSQSSREVTIGRETWQAHVYGRRRTETTREGVSLHGIALDGELALHESPVRVLDTGEKPRPGQQVIEICGVSGLPASLTEAALDSAPRSIEVAGRIEILCDPAHVGETERRLLAAESTPWSGPDPIDAGTGHAEAAWADGVKQVLVIRVDFSDGGALSGGPYNGGAGTTSSVVNTALVNSVLGETVSTFMTDGSRSLTSLSTTLAAKVYRMPQTAAYYATGGRNTELHTDARNAATADGYNLATFDRIMVVFSNLSGIKGSQITYGGLGSIEGRNTWINGFFNFRTVAHELGHNYGAQHANTLRVADGNPASRYGVHVEYGDPFDAMGDGVGADSRFHFNQRYKAQFGWITSQAVTADGVYRVYPFDNSATDPAATKALKVFRDGSRWYWIGYRQKFTDNPYLTNGAYVLWSYGKWDDRGTQLLDLTSPGTATEDAALGVGAAFTDADFGITIETLARGGSGPNEYLDLRITRRPPNASLASWGYSDPGEGSDVPAVFTNVRAIAGGANHAIGVKADHTAVAWGSNTYGQAAVPGGLVNVVAVAAGNNVSGVLNGDGTVLLWGDNTYNQVGGVPAGLNSVRQLSIGYNHVLALKTDGTVVAWGTNESGQLNVPTSLANVIAVAAGRGVSFALRSDGTVVRWGANYGGTLPTGGVTAIASGYYHLLALKSDGTVANWGTVFSGDLAMPAGLSGVSAIAAGNYHQLALKNDGTIAGWGDNASDQAIPPEGMPGAKAVAGGDYFSLAIVNGSVGGLTGFAVQPQSQGVKVGANVTLSVTAAGSGNFTYQWYKNGVLIPGATSSSYAIGSFGSGSVGSYTVGASDGVGFLTSAAAVLSIDTSVPVTPPAVPTGRMIALSVRSFAGTDENTLIAGLVTSGTSPTSLVVRGVGPGLSQAGITGFLADPQLRIFNGAGQPVTNNDDWGGTPALTNAFAAVGLAPLIPGSKDAALLLNLSPGVYTAQVTTASGSGIALMEAYDAEAPGNPTRLAALSVRSAVGTGGNILIVGVVISGTGPKSLLIRGLGPGLTQSGVPGALANPQLAVFNSSGQQLLSNDDWGGGAVLANAFASVGLPALPASSKDAALLASLEAGVYTVQLSGVSSTTGVGLIEIYEMP